MTVELKEYDPTQYDTLVTADLAAGTGPDIITQKNFKTFYTYPGGRAAAGCVRRASCPTAISGADSYKVDGKAYAVPYRQDSWVLFYNKDLFDKAGVKDPDGSWTWDDYAERGQGADHRAQGRRIQGVGDYQHDWQSTVQGFANSPRPRAQTS